MKACGGPAGSRIASDRRGARGVARRRCTALRIERAGAKTATMVVASLLVAAPSPEAQQTRELLSPVDPTVALRLEEYNATSLKEETYFASRHRIVRANDALLLDANEITVTPFGDMEPIRLSPLPGTPERAGRDLVFWKGGYRDDRAGAELARFGVPPMTVTISRSAWDMDPSGNAEQAFVSVDAVFDVPFGGKYVLTHLKYTPKYSVIYEIRRDTVIPIRIDVTPGDPDLSPAEKEAGARYQAFLQALPKETDKPIRGEPP